MLCRRFRRNHSVEIAPQSRQTTLPSTELHMQLLLQDRALESQVPKEITLSDISQDVITEAFANVEMPVASKKRASLQCKVDTDAGGNVMPL